MAVNNAAPPAKDYGKEMDLLNKQAQMDQASFQRSMGLMNLQRQQQEQMQMLNTLSAMTKNDHDGKMAIIRNLKAG